MASTKNLTGYLKTFGLNVNDVMAMYDDLLFCPKKKTEENAQRFYKYFEPCIILLCLIWHINLIRIMRKADDFIKKYGFMVFYTSLDLLAISIQDAFLIAFLTRQENYVEYNWCYAFQVGTVIGAHFLIRTSLWIKMMHSYQIFIIVYKPLTYRRYFNRRLVSIYMVLLFSLSFTISLFHFLDLEFEKIYVNDKNSNQFVEVCREPQIFSVNLANQTKYKVLEIADYICSAVLPFVSLTIFCISIVRVIRKQTKLWKMQNKNITAREKSTNRLVKVNVLSFIFSAVLLSPRLILSAIEMFTEFGSSVLYIVLYSSFIFNVCYICCIPITLFMFRNSMKKTWERTTKSCRKNTKSISEETTPTSKVSEETTPTSKVSEETMPTSKVSEETMPTSKVSEETTP
ncbi:unnamed protein product [Mytilus coruscus]|uniref:G-protein coupled receptors family 1 profile domain-containing protein n=1 Tax=Mytilus coruscus TaxID=42192 RepID=A0A6J7ZW93_MYTCO|nr:unnamed protein product [Mytilus coruscus]